MAEHLTREQVQDVLQFSEALWYAENSGVFTPYLSNQILANLNNNPRIPTTDKIKKALANYKATGKDLQGYTEFLTNYDMIFKRTLWSYANTLAFDLSMTCTNAFTREDFESEQFKKDKLKVYNFLDKFDYKNEFKKIVIQLLMNEVYFVWFRKTKWGNKGMQCAIQVLPQDRCMITGAWEKGFLFDFDLNFFLQAGVDINSYDPAFKKYYNRVFGENNNFLDYRPSNPLNERTGQFAYWTQTSPVDGAWVMKLNMSTTTTVPYLAPFLKDTMRNDEIEQLQYDKDMISAYAILAGEIRLFDNATSGTVANQFAITPEKIGAFMGKAKQGLGNLIKLAALPTENTKFFQFSDNNNDMYQNQLATTAGVGSGISRVIYSSDRMSNAEIEAGITDQYNTMRPLYYQFENFLNFYVNRLPIKYKWRFTFDGCSYAFDRENRFDKLMKLADKGLVLNSSAWASAIGMRPQDFDRSLMESKYSGWTDELSTMLMNANTSSYGSSEGGRPRSDNPDDSTDASREMRDDL